MVPSYVVKAHNHMLIWARSGLESTVESADSNTQLADSTTDSVIIGPLSLLNMFDILNPLELANGRQPTIGVGRRQIFLVGTGLNEFFFNLIHILVYTSQCCILCE